MADRRRTHPAAATRITVAGTSVSATLLLIAGFTASSNAADVQAAREEAKRVAEQAAQRRARQQADAADAADAADRKRPTKRIVRVIYRPVFTGSSGSVPTTGSTSTGSTSTGASTASAPAQSSGPAPAPAPAPEPAPAPAPAPQPQTQSGAS